MKPLTLQLNLPKKGWTTAGFLAFSNQFMSFEYDLDYASEYFERVDATAVSVHLPVNMEPIRSPLFSFVLDLIPQGEALRRVLSRYKINHETDYYDILAKVPLASPGNIRVLEPWQELDAMKASYSHRGFTREEIVKYQKDFVDYMQQVGAPIGGTSGAGGGSPKYLMREDHKGYFHAEGMLPDHKTKRCYIVKFPFTDSTNSLALVQAEKLYHDILRTLPIQTGEAIEIEDNALFIPRFDRIMSSNAKRPDSRITYLGLESFYAAHEIASHGARLTHEQNLQLLRSYSSKSQDDIIEYLKRDVINQLLANTDNHGRNWSLLKSSSQVRLSPMYDVTAMKFFSEPIVELTTWHESHRGLEARIKWVSEEFKIPRRKLIDSMHELYEAVQNLTDHMRRLKVPKDFITRSNVERVTLLVEMKSVI